MSRKVTPAMARRAAMRGEPDPWPRGPMYPFEPDPYTMDERRAIMEAYYEGLDAVKVRQSRRARAHTRKPPRRRGEFEFGIGVPYDEEDR